MNAIWKFPLTADVTEIEAPIDEFLTVQMQGNTPCVWAVVNPNKAPRKYKVMLIGTGWELQKIDVSRYIGTIQTRKYVWHCFWDKVPVYKNVKEPTLTMFSTTK